MVIQKLFFKNMFFILLVLQLNENTLAQEINMRFPVSNNVNNTKLNIQTIDKSKHKINFNKGFNTKPNLIKNNKPVVIFKNNNVEKEIIKNFNKQKNLSIDNQIWPNKEYKSNFKDYSSTFLSPYGGHVPRAPDESLKACNTKECYE